MGRLIAAGGLVLLLGAAPGALERVPEALPGALPLPAAMRQKLATELASRGPDYEPRTKQRHPDGSPRFTNRLLLEASPYLQQHAHNPVDWRPWGDAAFEAARRLGRPVLVSIGYSTCHWCHVMEDESFDDPVTAEVLNARFIAIKVDREVRPDVDAIYMAALHAMGESGGWPLNVFLTPDRKPFYGGTYFPPGEEGSRGRPGFRSLLRTLSQRYQDDPNGITGMSNRLAAMLRSELEGRNAEATRIPGPEALRAAKVYYAARFDAVNGGLQSRQKFPSSLPVRLLLRYHRRSGDAEALDMALTTLERMAGGGIHDVLGGGFHRYTVDPAWQVPHFEKMLYDNALLTLAYLEGWQVSGRTEFAEVARGILRYVARKVTAPGGAFYSASDADSLDPDGERVEGWFFTWTPEEVRAVLPAPAARAVILRYGVREQGRVEGRNVLRAALPLARVAAELETSEAELVPLLADARERLRLAREKRPPPHRDEKILTAWNGLMISAFARAGFALDEPEWTRRAAAAADFVLEHLRREDRLLRVWKGGRAEGPSFLEDHAFLIAGLLDLYEADADPRWLREALAIQQALDARYADEVGGGYTKTADDGERLLAREKPGRDGAVPSGNSVAAMNLLRLHEFTTDASHLERAAMVFSAFYDELVAQPGSLAEMRMALDAQLDTPKQVIVVGSPGAGLDALLAPLRRSFLPNRIVAVLEPEAVAAQASLVPVVKGKVARRGRPTAYVCVERVCELPTSEPEVFARQLAKVRALE